MENNSVVNTEAPPSSDDKTAAILAHCLTLLVGFIGPLIIYVTKTDSKFARKHAAEALNFQISFFLYVMVLMVGFFIAFIPVASDWAHLDPQSRDLPPGIGWILGLSGALVIGGLLSFIFTLIATIKASNGQLYRYPLCIHFIK